MHPFHGSSWGGTWIKHEAEPVAGEAVLVRIDVETIGEHRHGVLALGVGDFIESHTFSFLELQSEFHISLDANVGVELVTLSGVVGLALIIPQASPLSHP